MRCALRLAVLVSGLAGLVPVLAATPRTFTVDAPRSRASIQVGKSGALRFMAGHTHKVAAPIASGVVHFDPADPSGADVHLTFNAAALRVTGSGEPRGDVPIVQQTMLGERVLDVARYPTIAFDSTSVTVRGSAAALELSVAGTLTLHGVTHAVTAPVAVQLHGDTLIAAGRFTINQTDYGITPLSIARVVKVKNALNISFTVVARER